MLPPVNEGLPQGATMLSNLADLPQPLIQLIMHRMTELSARTSFRTVNRAARAVSDAATCKLSVSHARADSDMHVFGKELGRQFTNVNHLVVDCDCDLSPLEQLCMKCPKLIRQLEHIDIKAKVAMLSHLCPYLSKLRQACSPKCHVNLIMITDTDGFPLQNMAFDFPNQIPLEFIPLLQSATLHPSAALLDPVCAQHLTQLSIQSMHSRVDFYDLEDEDDFDLSDSVFYNDTDVFGNTEQALDLLRSLSSFSRLQRLHVSANLLTVASSALYHLSALTALTQLELSLECSRDEDLSIDDEGSTSLDWSLLGLVPSLQALVITSSMETSFAIPHDWSLLTALTRLFIYSGDLLGLENISTLTSLRELHLEHLAANTPPTFLEELRQLTRFECNLSFDAQLHVNADIPPTSTAAFMPGPPSHTMHNRVLIPASPVASITTASAPYHASPVIIHPLMGAAMHASLGVPMSRLFVNTAASTAYEYVVGTTNQCSPVDPLSIQCSQGFEARGSTESPSMVPHSTGPRSFPPSGCAAAAPSLPLASISFCSDEGIVPPQIMEASLPNLHTVVVAPSAAMRLEPKVIKWLSKPQLKVLDLRFNTTTSTALICQISNLQNLESLILTSQSGGRLDAFDAKLTRWLAGLTKLKTLELSFDSDTSHAGSPLPPLHSSSNLINLERLSLGLVCFDTQVSEWLAPLSHLTSLSIRHFSTSSAPSAQAPSNALTSLRNMSQLREVQLSNIVLDATTTDILAHLTSLESLKLASCASMLTSDTTCRSLHALERMRYLYISFQGPGLPQVMGWLSSAPGLKTLEIHHTHDTARGAGSFMPCCFARLQTIMIHKMAAEDIVRCLGCLHAPQLRELVGTGCDVPPGVALSLMIHCPLLRSSSIKQVFLKLSSENHQPQANGRSPLKSIQPPQTDFSATSTRMDAPAACTSACTFFAAMCTAPGLKQHSSPNLAQMARMVGQFPISTNSSPAGLSATLDAVASDIEALRLHIDGRKDLLAAFCSAWANSRQPNRLQLLDIDAVKALAPVLQKCEHLLSLALDAPYSTELTLEDAVHLVESCPKLESLRLSSIRNLKGCVLGVLADLKDLEFIRMYNCSWMDELDLVRWMKQLPKLKAVVLEECEQLAPALRVFRLSRRLAQDGVFVPVHTWEDPWMLPRCEQGM